MSGAGGLLIFVFICCFMLGAALCRKCQSDFLPRLEPLAKVGLCRNKKTFNFFRWLIFQIRAGHTVSEAGDGEWQLILNESHEMARIRSPNLIYSAICVKNGRIQLRIKDLSSCSSA